MYAKLKSKTFWCRRNLYHPFMRISLQVIMFDELPKSVLVMVLQFHNTVYILCIWGTSVHPSGGSRISPRRGRQLPRGRQNRILPNFPKNCMKLKEFGPPEGHASIVPPLRSATASPGHTHPRERVLTHPWTYPRRGISNHPSPRYPPLKGTWYQR